MVNHPVVNSPVFNRPVVNRPVINLPRTLPIMFPSFTVIDDIINTFNVAGIIIIIAMSLVPTATGIHVRVCMIPAILIAGFGIHVLYPAAIELAKLIRKHGTKVLFTIRGLIFMFVIQKMVIVELAIMALAVPVVTVAVMPVFVKFLKREMTMIASVVDKVFLIILTSLVFGIILIILRLATVDYTPWKPGSSFPLLGQ